MAAQEQLFLFGTGNQDGRPGDLVAGIITANHRLGADLVQRLLRQEAAGRAGSILTKGFLQPVEDLKMAAIYLHNRGHACQLKAVKVLPGRAISYEEDFEKLEEFKEAIGIKESVPPTARRSPYADAPL